jgi:NADPH:quinone reductase-like Zn-dependent oxidoreductase
LGFPFQSDNDIKERPDTAKNSEILINRKLGLTQMKAAVITEYGGIDKVNIAEVNTPKPGANEVLIQVKSAALNHLDIWVCKGRPGAKKNGSHIIGSDASGIITEIGAGVNGVSVGSEVLINPGLSCGVCEYCRRGEQSECSSFDIVGLGRQGTFAEYVVVPAGNVYTKPAHLDFNEAAALPLSYVTAWRMLMTRAELQAGQTVLIHGIGGGVAIAALQFAKMAGAVVIVTSSSDEKLKKAENLGADHDINYKNKDVSAAVRDITSGRGVDICFDTVGAATMPINFEAVRRGGKIVICGVTSGPKSELNLQALYWNQLSIMGSTMGSNDDFFRMLSAINAARLKPVVDSVFPLAEVRNAMTKMETGTQFGKIVLKIS